MQKRKKKLINNIQPDAIYHLAYGKSYFNPLAVQNIKHGEDFFVIEGVFEKNKATGAFNLLNNLQNRI